MVDLLRKVVRKIKFVSQDIWTYVLIKFSVIVNSPKLAARFASWLVKDINDVGEYRVLCMRRSVFIDDVKAMSRMSGRLHYLMISRRIFQLIFEHFADREEYEKLTDLNYYSNQYCQQAKGKYCDFLKKMLPYLQSFITFDAILSANITYRDQQEISRVAEELDIPYIVLHKESLNVGVLESTYVGCKFLGAKVLVYNENQADTLASDTGPDGVTEDKIKVVGIPRFDFLFRKSNKKSHANRVVFFSFNPRDKFPRIAKDKKTLDEAYQHAEAFHVWVMRFADDHPDIEVIIKTKKASTYLDYVRDIFQRNFQKQIPNLSITSSGNPIGLIGDSKIVCAYGSLTIVESLMQGKVVVSPYFADLVSDEQWGYFQEAPEMVNYVRTEQEFRQQLLSPQKRYQNTERDKFLRQYIYVPDGQASRRAEEAIIKVVKEYEKYRQ